MQPHMSTISFLLEFRQTILRLVDWYVVTKRKLHVVFFKFLILFTVVLDGNVSSASDVLGAVKTNIVNIFNYLFVAAKTTQDVAARGLFKRKRKHEHSEHSEHSVHSEHTSVLPSVLDHSKPIADKSFMSKLEKISAIIKDDEEITVIESRPSSKPRSVVYAGLTVEGVLPTTYTVTYATKAFYLFGGEPTLYSLSSYLGWYYGKPQQLMMICTRKHAALCSNIDFNSSTEQLTGKTKIHSAELATLPFVQTKLCLMGDVKTE